MAGSGSWAISDGYSMRRPHDDYEIDSTHWVLHSNCCCSTLDCLRKNRSCETKESQMGR